MTHIENDLPAHVSGHFEELARSIVDLAFVFPRSAWLLFEVVPKGRVPAKKNSGEKSFGLFCEISRTHPRSDQTRWSGIFLLLITEVERDKKIFVVHPFGVSVFFRGRH